MSEGKVVVVGSVVQDRVHQVAVLPVPGESAIVEAILDTAGGKGANQAAAAARLGAETAFLGCVGEDEAAKTAAADLEKHGVRATLVKTAEAETGHATVLVDESGENLIAVRFGANDHLAPEHVEAHAETFDSATVFVTQLESPTETVVAVRDLADRHEAMSILNAAPARLDARDAFRGFDLVVVNQVEAEMFAEVGIQTMDDVFASMRAIKNLGAKSVIVTLGDAGAAVLHDGSAKHVKTPVLEAVDATGAGDAFVGALAALVARGVELEDAVARACRYGALATTAVGARAGYGDLTALEAFEKELGVEDD